VRFLLSILALTALVAVPGPANAQTYKFVDGDGTVHYTNAPTDPGYRRMAMARSGTSAGWLRLPQGPAGVTGVYAPHIKAAASRYGVSEKVVAAVIRAESAFNPRAVSSKGARGLMQLMPQTASILGVRNSFDPAENIDGGVRHLRGLLDRFNDLPLALAAYNAGEGAVNQYRGIPPYPETQGYVKKILGYLEAPEPAAPGPPPPALSETFKVTLGDGTTVYTNIPPRGRP
jgi:soluble lytic murein transglycosylase-like protein